MLIEALCCCWYLNTVEPRNGTNGQLVLCFLKMLSFLSADDKISQLSAELESG